VILSAAAHLVTLIRAVRSRRIRVYTSLVRTHEWIDRRSLALHTAVAKKLEARPELVDVARANLARWRSTNPAPALQDWQDLLDAAPLAQLAALLRSPAEDACRLRQSSPFAGILSPEERRAILDRYEPPGA
jgi:hypothetical protein